jgi:hypothetical protein
MRSNREKSVTIKILSCAKNEIQVFRITYSCKYGINHFALACFSFLSDSSTQKPRAFSRVACCVNPTGKTERRR